MAYVQPCAYGRARPKLGDNIARRAATPRLCASAHNLSLFHTWHIITHIFLAPNDGQVRRTVRGRCDCADNGWTVHRTRVDENDSRGQCATHRSKTDLFGLMICDWCDAQIHSPTCG